MGAAFNLGRLLRLEGGQALYWGRSILGEILWPPAREAYFCLLSAAEVSGMQSSRVSFGVTVLPQNGLWGPASGLHCRTHCIWVLEHLSGNGLGAATVVSRMTVDAGWLWALCLFMILRLQTFIRSPEGFTS